jgi:hypothetical protein
MEKVMPYFKVFVSFHPVPRTFKINTGCVDLDQSKLGSQSGN